MKKLMNYVKRLGKRYMHNIVFLDIDGVVNTIQVDSKPFKGRMFYREPDENGLYYYYGDILDNKVSNHQAIMWLNKLCKETNSKIVISSTWRYSGLEKVKSALYNSGLFKDIEIVGETERLNIERKEEIKSWLEENHKIVNNFVILDDDTIEFDNFVKIDGTKGFGYTEYNKAKEILKADTKVGF